jgi:hypothetical protein
VAGLLVGRVLLTEPLGVIVTDILEFPDYDSSGAHVTVPAAVWAQVDGIFEERFGRAKLDRVGWYHTHPTQGILFSRQDCDFHSVFTREFQVALVVDPLSMKAGIYFWADEERTRITLEPIIFPIPRRFLSHTGGVDVPPRIELSPRERISAAQELPRDHNRDRTEVRDAEAPPPNRVISESVIRGRASSDDFWFIMIVIVLSIICLFLFLGGLRSF